MSERQRGSLRRGRGLTNGALLDQLVVRLDLDLSGFRAGIREAITEIRTLKGALTAQVGGVSVSDAMTAALVAPLIVATARIGNMRTELRALTAEMRGSALLLGGPGGSGMGPIPRGNSLMVPGSFAAGAGFGGVVLDAAPRRFPDGSRALSRHSNGRLASAWDIDSGDDLRGAASGDFGNGNRGGGGGIPPIGVVPVGGGNNSGDDDNDRRRGGRRGRRTPAWFFNYIRGGNDQSAWRNRSPGEAFMRAQNGFPGMDDAMEGIGSSARRAGSGLRGAAGSRLAQTLGLVGLGSVMGSLVGVAASLATVIGGVLAGAFAALMTPLGLVLGLLTAVAALFVAANWDSLVEFWDRFKGEAAGQITAGLDAIKRGWNSLGLAFAELIAVFRSEDGANGLIAVLTGLGQVIVRTFNAMGQIVGGALSVVAELISAFAALLRGDWDDLWNHIGRAFAAALNAVKEALFAWFPELRTAWDEFWGWMEGRAQSASEAIGRFFNPPEERTPQQRERSNLRNSNRGGPGGGRSRGKAISGAGTGGGSYSDSFYAPTLKSMMGLREGDAPSVFKETANDNNVGLTDDQLERLERGQRLADSFGQSLMSAFDNGIQSGAKFSDILRGLVADLVMMFIRITMLEPLTAQFGQSFSAAFGGGGGGKGGGGGFMSAIGSIFSSFGGFFAEGGYLKPGQWGVAGERGAEIIRAGRDGMSIFKSGTGPGGGPSSIVYAPSYKFTGTAEEIAAVRRMVANDRAQFDAKVKSTMANANTRGKAWA